MNNYNSQNFNGEADFNQENRSVVSVGDWMITILIMVFPIVNIVMLFVWSFSSSTPKSKANWAKATLIWMAIGFLVLILFWSSIAALFIASSYNY